MLHGGPLGDGQVIDQRGRASRKGARRGGGTPAVAAAVVGTVGRGAGRLARRGLVLVLGGRGGRAHLFVGDLEQACVLAALRRHGHSHSMVPGGFDVTSSATRFTPSTSLMMREAMRSTRS